MKFACLFIFLDLFRYGMYHRFNQLYIDHGHDRIIGGELAKVEDYPATVCLIRKDMLGDNFRGGAVIIGKFWDYHIEEKLAFVRSNSTFWEHSYAEHLIVGKYIHENFDDETLDFDIALVKVKEPFTAVNEKPIKLAQTNYQYIDDTLTTTLGWGTTNPDAPPYFHVEELRVVNISLVNFESCQQAYEDTEYHLTDRMICAAASGKDSCVYDSGGPLYQNNILIGVVSWGPEKCAEEGYPGVYTKISVFHEWIQKKVKTLCKKRKKKKKYL